MFRPRKTSFLPPPFRPAPLRAYIMRNPIKHTWRRARRELRSVPRLLALWTLMGVSTLAGICLIVASVALVIVGPR